VNIAFFSELDSSHLKASLVSKLKKHVLNFEDPASITIIFAFILFESLLELKRNLPNENSKTCFNSVIFLDNAVKSCSQSFPAKSNSHHDTEIKMQNPTNDEEEATINIPSSHDIFDKMLEEELRREEERMKSKGVSSVLNNGNKKSSEEAPLKPPPQSKKELSIHLRSDKETSKKLSTTSPQDEFTVHQLEPTRSESPTLPSEPKSASKSNRTIALEMDPIVTAEDTTPEEQLLDHPSPIDNADVMITEGDLVESDMPPVIITGKDVNNFLTPATPLSSNALFEQMLQQELDNDSQISNTEERPLWKKQVEELDSLISRFKTADPNDNLFQESGK